MWGFREVYLVDFEFQQLDGGVPTPICMVAREFLSGKLIRLWLWGTEPPDRPPFATDPGVLLVAYYSAAEILCFLALAWKIPERVLDLCVEFKRRTSGLDVPCGRGLLGALVSHGIPSMASEHKEEMRQLAMRGGPYSSEEKRALLDYCQEDVDALAQLLPAMAREIRPRLGQALLRGREMAAIARMEWTGIPIDVATWERVRDELPEVREQLIETVDREFGVYENSVFKRDRFAALLAKRGVPWPRLPSGALELKDQTFRDMCRAHPWLSPLRELRYTLGQLKLHDLAVGPDGRNRCMLSAFQSKTGRNQPSNTKFVFGPAVWIRGFIQPEPETALVYLDWEQQEFGIAASLSGDAAMTAAYTSNDPYLAFAIQAGAAPVDATKASHPDIREAFKACVLAVQYGMGARALGLRIGKPAPYAQELLDLHRKTYSRFWNWSDGAVRRRCLRDRWRRSLVGRSTSTITRTNVPCGTFRCRATAAKCFGSAAHS
jgi:DNA polymerase-1